MKRLKEWMATQPPVLVDRTCTEHSVVTRLGYPSKLSVRYVTIRPFEFIHHRRFKQRFRRPKDVIVTSWLLVAVITFKDHTDLLFKKEYWVPTLTEAIDELNNDITQMLSIYNCVTQLRYGKPRH